MNRNMKNVRREIFLLIIFMSFVFVIIDIDWLLLTWIGKMTAILIMFVYPGYLIQTLVLPSLYKYSLVTRIAFSVTLSFSVLAILTLLFEGFGIGLGDERILRGYSLGCLVLAGIGFVNGNGKDAIDADAVVEIGEKNDKVGVGDYLTFVIGAVLVVGVLMVFSQKIIKLENSGEKYTEFFVSPDSIIGYTLRDGNRVVRIPIEIRNHEGKAGIYGVLVEVDGNLIDGEWPISVANGEGWMDDLELELLDDSEKITISLVMEGKSENPYRLLSVDLKSMELLPEEE